MRIASILLATHGFFCPTLLYASGPQSEGDTIAAAIDRGEGEQTRRKIAGAPAPRRSQDEVDADIIANGTENAAIDGAKRTIVVADGGPLEREGNGSGANKGVAVSDFELATSDNRVVANLAFGYVMNDVNHSDLKGGDHDYRFTANSVRLTGKITVPVNGTDARQFADFKHIGDDSKLTFSAVYFRSGHNDGHTRFRVMNLATGECIARAGELWVTASQDSGANGRAAQAQNFYDSYIAAVKDPGQDGGAVVEDIAEEKPEFGKIAVEFCVPGNGKISDDDDLLRKYGQAALGNQAYPLFKRRFLDAGMLWFAGANLTAGYERYDILNRGLFRIDVVDRVGFDGTLFGGFVAPNGSMAGKMTFGYARGYTTQAEAEHCRATALAGQADCIKGQDGAPVRKDKGYLKGEFRWVLKQNALGQPQFAIAPEVTYDLKDKGWIFDLPIYLQRKETTGLDGGIRLGYDTKGKDFGAGVFVGIPFATWF